MQNHQPGEVIIPHGPNQTDTQDQLPPVENEERALPTLSPSPDTELPSPETDAAPAPILAPSQPDPAPSLPLTDASQPKPDNSWYRPEPSIPEAPRSMPSGGTQASLMWEAAEYEHHHKTPAWFGGATVLAALLSVAIYFLNRDIITAVIVFLAIVGLVFFGARAPRTQQYEMDEQGVRVGRKQYEFADFRSFSITADTPTTRNIILTPLKRFMPYVTINLPPEQEDAAARILGAALPMDQARGDAVDTFMKRLRF